MSAKGKLAETEFERHWKSRGKGAYLHRITDAAEVRGMNQGRASVVKKQPADYVLVADGFSGFAEVKSTAGPRFDFNLIKGHQLGAAERVVKAGGDYDFFVRRLHPTDPAWFRVPAADIVDHDSRSLTWADLEKYRVAIPIDLPKPRITV